MYKCRQLGEFRINSTPGSTWLIAWPYSPGQGESCLFLPWHLLCKSNPWTYSVLDLEQLLKVDDSSLPWQGKHLAPDVRLPWGGKDKATAFCSAWVGAGSLGEEIDYWQLLQWQCLSLMKFEHRKIVMGAVEGGGRVPTQQGGLPLFSQVLASQRWLHKHWYLTQSLS